MNKNRKMIKFHRKQMLISNPLTAANTQQQTQQQNPLKCPPQAQKIQNPKVPKPETVVTTSNLNPNPNSKPNYPVMTTQMDKLQIPKQMMKMESAVSRLKAKLVTMMDGEPVVKIDSLFENQVVRRLTGTATNNNSRQSFSNKYIPNELQMPPSNPAPTLEQSQPYQQYPNRSKIRKQGKNNLLNIFEDTCDIKDNDNASVSASMSFNFDYDNGRNERMVGMGLGGDGGTNLANKYNQKQKNYLQLLTQNNRTHIPLSQAFQSKPSENLPPLPPNYHPHYQYQYQYQNEYQSKSQNQFQYRQQRHRYQRHNQKQNQRQQISEQVRHGHNRKYTNMPSQLPLLLGAQTDIGGFNFG